MADTLERWLRDRQLLLVLDNCEPVVGAVASFAERYLARCAGVRILATSREVLGVRGERALGTPPLNVTDDPARAGESDAVELFMVRASAAAPSFDADAADVATVAQICRRLDGLPLAIELAAARLRALSLEQVATRLDDRFRLLGAGERTLEAVVAWSYDLLTEAEREVFVRLAVFPADFSLEATEMVVSDAVVEEGDDPRSAHAPRREVTRHDGDRRATPAGTGCSRRCGSMRSPDSMSAARSIVGTTGCSSGP